MIQLKFFDFKAGYKVHILEIATQCSNFQEKQQYGHLLSCHQNQDSTIKIAFNKNRLPKTKVKHWKAMKEKLFNS